MSLYDGCYGSEVVPWTLDNRNYCFDHFGWSNVLLDMTAIAWLINDAWLPSELVHNPVVTDNHTYRFDNNRHCPPYIRRKIFFL